MSFTTFSELVYPQNDLRFFGEIVTNVLHIKLNRLCFCGRHNQSKMQFRRTLK